jgi:predicted GH43/DUF377 family glycosyl hydrolase
MQTFKLATILLASIICMMGCTQKTDVKETNQTWAMLDFEKVDSINPIMKPDSSQVFDCPISKKSIQWEARNVLNPSAIVKDGKIYLIYRAQDSAGTSRIGVAISEDGLHFKKMPTPVLYPDEDSLKKYEWHGGIEDPRVVETEDGNYLLTYTSYDGKTARLCFAFSKDLMHWEKMGPVLKNEKYIDTWSKSGAIIVEEKNGKMVTAKVNGKYWMYYGDTDIFMASSDDLKNWEGCENEESKKLISVLHPRMGYHDSRLVEPGPYALKTKDGILLIYNGSNAANFNDTTKPKFTYSAGQALFETNEPYKLKDRTAKDFIRPDKPYERTGEVNEVCFVEGLVHFNNKWFLYYGTADSRIAVAVK